MKTTDIKYRMCIILCAMIFYVYLNRILILWQKWNLLNIVITDISEVISLRVTAQVIVELVEENAGNQLCVFCQLQLIGKFWNLTADLQNLLEAYVFISIKKTTNIKTWNFSPSISLKGME